VDISENMLALARERDPEGEYRLVPDGELPGIETGVFDLVLSVFTFDNIPTMEKKSALLGALGDLLNEHGRIVSLVSSPEIYVNEWASFSTRDFPQNRDARSGDTVLIVMLDVDDRRPVEDVMWTDDDYREAYRRAGLKSIDIHKPLGRPAEPFEWVSEEKISPWVIYVLQRSGEGGPVT
jgi:SAM-dependent methyltransferase